MGRLGVASLGLRGGLIGVSGDITNIYIETPIDGFFQNELEFFGEHENELIRDGYIQTEESPLEGSFEDELALYGDHEYELEYEGYYNE